MSIRAITRRRFALITAAVVALGAGAFFAADRASAQSDKSGGGPDLIAVKFHADWCGYCRQMGTVFQDLEAKHNDKPVLYLTFDQTEDADTRQSRYLAHALGMERIWSEYGGKTGFVLLIDAESHKVVKRLGHKQDLASMSEDLLAAVEK